MEKSMMEKFVMEMSVLLHLPSTSMKTISSGMFSKTIKFK